MKSKLKTSLKQNSTLLIISTAAVLSGILACFIGDIALPLIIGTLAAVCLFDTTEKRYYTLFVSVILVAVNSAVIFTGITVSIFSIAAIIISHLVAASFNKGQSKADTAYISTLICALFTIIAALLLAMIQQGVYTIGAAVEYYNELIQLLKSTFVDYLSQAYTMAGVEFSAEDIGAIFDQEIKMMISYLFIAGFATVGLGMKLFSAIVKKCAEEPRFIGEWRFGATRFYAYFYVALMIVNVFTTDLSSVFAIAAFNLYNIFSIVFAYIGLRLVIQNMRMRRRSVFSVVLLLIACLLFITFAVSLLAFFGVINSLRRPEQTQNK